MTERILPPSPSSTRQQRKASTESDFWAELFLDLTVRVEWLGQALDAVPTEDASAESLVRLRSYSRALGELYQAIANMQAHRADPELKPLFLLEGPLAGYLSRIYGWCDEIGEDFERMAVALRRRQPTSIVFEHAKVNKSYAQFAAHVSAIRKTTEITHERRAQAMSPSDVAHERRGKPKNENVRAFDEHLEELIWATEWVHMALARAPGS